MRRAAWSTVVLGALLAACGAGEGAASRPASASAALDVGNGKDLNGKDLNGKDLNGKDLNGKDLNGKDLNGPGLASFLVSVDLEPVLLAQGSRLASASLQASRLSVKSGHQTFTGAALVGAMLVGNVGSGAPVLLRLSAYQNVAGVHGTIDQYQAQWFDLTRGWRPVCVDDDGDAEWATAINGVWDYTQGTATGGSKHADAHRFTLACATGAISKCVSWGYEPWASVNGQSLDAYHQACTRLARADYCGDGLSHTEDGELINLYDDLGVQTDTEPWILEAQWSPAGATCLAPTVPPSGIACYAQKASPACSADDPSAMLTTETPTGARVPQN